MGRQHTTWISDENWQKLQNIGGDSISGKIGNAISMVDPDREMLLNSEKRRLERLVAAMKCINDLLVRENVDDLMGTIVKIELIVDEVEFCWRD
jgi:hypothetical protein